MTPKTGTHRDGTKTATRTKKQIETEKKKVEILEYRKAGFTIRQIAEATGISKSQVDRLLKAALTDATRTSAQDLITLNTERLETLLAGAWGTAVAGDPGTISSVLQIMRHQERLHGVDKHLNATTEDESTKNAAKALTDFMAAATAYAEQQDPTTTTN
ncbi:helix-turn-helix domain-containing protein [Actinotignum sp. GS-2025e]|uniref:helix-turn-helix domain-containing protein n=1 Tax=unclassified Actinotignum TaxID=2632702 RepID=UPI003F473AD0